MKVTSILKCGLAAVALLSTTALPATAHGAIDRGEMYYDYVFNGYNYDKVWVGEVRYYCDGHVRTYGTQMGEPEYYYTGC